MNPPKVLTMKPPTAGYSVGNGGAAAEEPSSGRSIWLTIFVAALGMAAGAVLIKLMDRTVFAGEKKEEMDALRRELMAAQQQGAPPARPRMLPSSASTVILQVPREAMTDELWARLAGEDYG